MKHQLEALEELTEWVGHIGSVGESPFIEIRGGEVVLGDELGPPEIIGDLGDLTEETRAKVLQLLGR